MQYDRLTDRDALAVRLERAFEALDADPNTDWREAMRKAIITVELAPLVQNIDGYDINMLKEAARVLRIKGVTQEMLAAACENLAAARKIMEQEMAALWEAWKENNVPLCVELRLQEKREEAKA